MFSTLHMDSQELINDFLLLGKPSSENYDSIQQPFFTKDANVEVNKKYDTEEIDAILEKYSFPDLLRNIYRSIGNKLVEYYYKDWVLISLENIEKRVNIYRGDGQRRVVDFAHKYYGMGHCIVASFDIEDKKIFYRRDGGANGYERAANYRTMVEYTPKEEHKCEVMDWLWYINSESEEYPLCIN